MIERNKNQSVYYVYHKETVINVLLQHSYYTYPEDFLIIPC